MSKEKETVCVPSLTFERKEGTDDFVIGEGNNEVCLPQKTIELLKFHADRQRSESFQKCLLDTEEEGGCLSCGS